MDYFKIEWKHSAERELRRIDKRYIHRIIKAVESLDVSPFPSRHRKLHSVESSYRIRVGDYRVVYRVDSEDKRVIVYHVRHRKEVYRK